MIHVYNQINFNQIWMRIKCGSDVLTGFTCIPCGALMESTTAVGRVRTPNSCAKNRAAELRTFTTLGRTMCASRRFASVRYESACARLIYGMRAHILCIVMHANEYRVHNMHPCREGELCFPSHRTCCITAWVI